MITSKTKKNLLETCAKIVAKKVNTYQHALTEAQESANNETKSSAGDKHETGRAMAQLETEKLTSQLIESTKLKDVLDIIDLEIKHNSVRLGSLVKTNNGTFFITVSLGKVTLDQTDYFVISSVSPIGKNLIGLKPKDEFSFNGRKYVIEQLV